MKNIKLLAFLLCINELTVTSSTEYQHDMQDSNTQETNSNNRIPSSIIEGLIQQHEQASTVMNNKHLQARKSLNWGFDERRTSITKEHRQERVNLENSHKTNVINAFNQYFTFPKNILNDPKISGNDLITLYRFLENAPQRTSNIPDNVLNYLNSKVKILQEHSILFKNNNVRNYLQSIYNLNNNYIDETIKQSLSKIFQNAPTIAEGLKRLSSLQKEKLAFIITHGGSLLAITIWYIYHLATLPIRKL